MGIVLLEVCVWFFLLFIADIELKALKQELSHHQNKLDEYHALKDEIDRFQGKWWSTLTKYHDYNVSLAPCEY